MQTAVAKMYNASRAAQLRPFPPIPLRSFSFFSGVRVRPCYAVMCTTTPSRIRRFTARKIAQGNKHRPINWYILLLSLSYCSGQSFLRRYNKCGESLPCGVRRSFMMHITLLRPLAAAAFLSAPSVFAHRPHSALSTDMWEEKKEGRSLGVITIHLFT